jgi:hypothetical protein
MPISHHACLVAAVMLLSPSPANAAKGDLKIAPGPATISEDEKAIQADPNKGMEHGVILLEETERDESLGTDTQVSYHLRAKILSDEGRTLGNVEIPFNTRSGQLKQWWGRVLCPGGSDTVLREDQLQGHTEVRTSSREYRVLKGILPGVAVGCVIDYGYVFWDSGVSDRTRLSLQRAWPVQLLRYKWIPNPASARSFRSTRTEGLSIDVQKSDRSYIITGRDLPPVPAEPWMPSDDAVRGMATFYYLDAKVDVRDYWNSEAKKEDREARSFASPDRAVRETIATMKIPEGAELRAKLRAAYDWLAANVRSTVLVTPEEEERVTDRKKHEDEMERRGFTEVLAAKEGLPRQLDDIYMGLARALGAEASLVLVTDRTDHYWDPDLLTLSQFDWSLVAVRAPGEPDEKAILVDPGSGLPFGEIPWVVTGPRGLLTSEKGYREIPLPPSDLERNVSETRADLSFAGGSVNARFSRTGSGQQGYLARRQLRRLPPAERQMRIDALCGAGASFDVSKAEAPKALVDVNAGFAISCEGTLSAPAPDEGVAHYGLKIGGPWFERVPFLPSATRVHPLVFDFPKIDATILAVGSPEGFAPGAPPPPVHLESAFGRYTLEVKVTSAGYEVDRRFWFGPLMVPPAQYANLRAFLTDVQAADGTTLDFKRKGG